MVRQARIDFPGALHHVMVRGIERRSIFKSKADKESLLTRLEAVLLETQTNCYAFAVMDTHFHLLLQTGPTSLSRVMQSILTGYAVKYNIQHKRSGKLYQNRFKSILCDKNEYFLQLIRYIHLNPYRAGLVPSINALKDYPWTGHAALMGIRKAPWLDTEEILLQFGRSQKAARKSYKEYIQAGLSEEEAENLRGGGLIRSLGGLWETLKASRRKDRELGDERILGSGAFIESVLKQTEEQESSASKHLREGWDFDKVRTLVCKVLDISPSELESRGLKNTGSQGRALLCKWMCVDIGELQAIMAEKLGVSRPGMSKLVKRGRAVEGELGVSFEKARKKRLVN
jgi:REP element-mobilizing transposase RayT